MTTRFNPFRTDGYKLTHWKMLPDDIEILYSYAEARKNSKLDTIVFFGLQPLLDGLANVDLADWSDDLREFGQRYFGDASYVNADAWDRLYEDYGNNLPIRISALPEGTICQPGDILYTIENTDPDYAWLTNYLESYLQKSWYPMTVASYSRKVKEMYAKALYETSGSLEGLEWKLHDFGYRGASSEESAEIGGAAHLVNFNGTDTIIAGALISIHYGVEPMGFMGSVPASEHSVMTSYGPEGEARIVGELLERFPTGTLSVVADSYNVYNFVENIVCRQYKDAILERPGTFVVRPDSNTLRHPNPEDQVLWIYETLWEAFGGTVTDQRFMLLNPKVNVLWGDGIGPDGIKKIIDRLVEAGFVPTFISGMGGGLLQKVSRDDSSFAIKCSAQRRDGEWYNVVKNPLDQSKRSKSGRFLDPKYGLETVFENGKVVKRYNFHQVRELADRGLI